MLVLGVFVSVVIVGPDVVPLVVLDVVPLVVVPPVVLTVVPVVVAAIRFKTKNGHVC